jgi:hypothetical protein
MASALIIVAVVAALPQLFLVPQAQSEQVALAVVALVERFILAAAELMFNPQQAHPTQEVEAEVEPAFHYKPDKTAARAL